MQTLKLVFGCAMGLGLAAHAYADAAGQIFDRMFEREAAALQDIDSMLLGTETMGMTQLEYFEKISAIDVNGETMYVLRNVPPNEMDQRRSHGNPLADASSDELRRAAGVIEQQGVVVEREFEREMQNAGLPGGLGKMLMNPPPDEPWLSPNPGHMMGMYGTMLRASADAKDMQAAEQATAFDGRSERAQIAAMTQLLGETTVHDRQAFHMLASGLDHRQVSDGVEFTLNSIEMWVDAREYVPLRLKMDGMLREGGETRAMTIERHDLDYRRVEGCGAMYRPFKTVMNITGMMNAEQQAQMGEAQVQLAEMEKQLSQMSPAQREMIMSRMGPQMAMIKNMASGSGIEVAQNVTSMRCNVPMPSSLDMAQAALGGALVPAPPGGELAAPALAAAPAARDPAALHAAQRACLEERAAAAQAASRKKQGVGRLLGAVSRVATRGGNQELARAAGEVYSASETVDDLSAAARDLGLTQDDAEACRNPQ